jgi:hypothetical protein
MISFAILTAPRRGSHRVIPPVRPSKIDNNVFPLPRRRSSVSSVVDLKAAHSHPLYSDSFRKRQLPHRRTVPRNLWVARAGTPSQSPATSSSSILPSRSSCPTQQSRTWSSLSWRCNVSLCSLIFFGHWLHRVYSFHPTSDISQWMQRELTKHIPNSRPED